MHIEPGISRALAQDRAGRVRELRYDVQLTLPGERDTPIAGRIGITFDLLDASTTLLLDFAPAGPGSMRELSANGVTVNPLMINGHIVLEREWLRAGRNEFAIAFVAGDAPLNRRDDHLYSIFVPARAHEALPCFDQPDLKARWTLTLDVPDAWVAISNTRPVRETRVPDGGRARRVVTFAETRPLPSYLFAFAAGAFTTEVSIVDGRPMRLHACGVDGELLAANRETIFEAHAQALSWMESYTGIPNPFDTADIVLLPAFQFSGMEHPGAIFYNASSLLLPASATQQQLLARANVIAHETAHLWFGDLVTMTWFDDVWMKEVFANFMGAKIVNPQFANLDHDLRFFHAHYPGAYDVDRTAGTHPIRQRLENLADAGSLYGAIIYLKSPIVMRQLELRLGEDRLREVLREYLARFAYANAAWPDLVDLLVLHGLPDAHAWSGAWIDRAGRPLVRSEVTVRDGLVDAASLSAEARAASPTSLSGIDGRHLLASQRLDVAVGRNGSIEHVSVWHEQHTMLEPLHGMPAPDFLLPGGGGLGYGEFELDPRSRDWLLASLPAVPDALTRASAWLTLWDAMLAGGIAADALLETALASLATEGSELNVQRLLSSVERLFWIFTGAQHDTDRCARVESALRSLLHSVPEISVKAAVLASLRSVATSELTIAWLRQVWAGEATIPGLELGEADYIALAQELAVRGDTDIVGAQLARTTAPDRRAALAFVAPALSHDDNERRWFVASLTDAANRRREPWVVEGLRWVHHPLREVTSVKYLQQGLELLEDVKRTGDIFLPKRWLDAMLSGHRSRAAAQIVRAFLASRAPSYPPSLTRMVLASADQLFRAVALQHRIRSTDVEGGGQMSEG